MILLYPSEKDMNTVKEFGRAIFEDKINEVIFLKYLDVIDKNEFDPFSYASDLEFAHSYATNNFSNKPYSEVIKSKEWQYFIKLAYNDPDFCGEYAECEGSDNPVGPLSKIDYDDYLKNGPLKSVSEIN